MSTSLMHALVSLSTLSAASSPPPRARSASDGGCTPLLSSSSASPSSSPLRSFVSSSHSCIGLPSSSSSASTSPPASPPSSPPPLSCSSSMHHSSLGSRSISTSSPSISLPPASPSPPLNLSSSMESYKMDLSFLTNTKLTPQAQAAADRWIACLEEENASLTLMGMAELHEWQQKKHMRIAHQHQQHHQENKNTPSLNGDGGCESGIAGASSPSPSFSPPSPCPSPSPPPSLSSSSCSSPASSPSLYAGPSVELQEALRSAAGRYVIRRSNACKTHKEMKRRCPENCPHRKAGWSEKKAKKSMSNLRAKRTYAVLAEQEKISDQLQNVYRNSFQQKWRNRMVVSAHNSSGSASS